VESWLISFELALHIGAGYIGALLAFPLTIAARKGSSWHKISGRVFVGAFVIICLTGYLLDCDEILDLVVFRPWSKLNHVPVLYNVKSTLGFREIVVMATSAINTFALYLAISGWRVWSRRKAVNASKIQWIDVFYSIMEIIACLVFVVAFWHIIPDTGKSPLFFVAVPFVAAVPLLDAGNDLIQTLRCLSPQHCWIQHARKLAMAEAGLFAAIALRCAPEQYVILSMLASVLLIALPTIWFVRRRLGTQ
jgi:hypothetical protein